MRRNGLSKYDAPLRIQYQWGYEAFKRGGRPVSYTHLTLPTIYSV